MYDYIYAIWLEETHAIGCVDQYSDIDIII